MPLNVAWVFLCTGILFWRTDFREYSLTAGICTGRTLTKGIWAVWVTLMDFDLSPVRVIGYWSKRPISNPLHCCIMISYFKLYLINNWIYNVKLVFYTIIYTSLTENLYNIWFLDWLSAKTNIKEFKSFIVLVVSDVLVFVVTNLVSRNCGSSLQICS